MSTPLASPGSCPGPHASQQATQLIVPAELANLRDIRAAVAATLNGMEAANRCERDVQLAADELGAALIQAAPPESQLQLRINCGAQDVCVHMVVAAPAPFALAIPDLSRRVLDATCDYYEMRVGDRELSGEMQREIRHRP